MKILLIGNTGQLGWELEHTLAPLGEVIAMDYPEIDLANPDMIRVMVRKIKPRVIVNPAAYTNVDKAESEPDLAFAINGAAPGILAEEARSLNAALIHYSTDYVFDGEKGSPYTEDDTPNPINTYGKSKLAGEQAIQAVGGAYLILRTAWVYSLRRDSFVTKVLEWSKQKKTLRIVDDQISNPTWARMLAETTSFLLAKSDRDIVRWIKKRYGLYHLAGGGYVSRFDWAKTILRFANLSLSVNPAKTRDFPAPANRPLLSALNCDRFIDAFGLNMPSWQVELKMAMGRDYLNNCVKTFTSVS